MAKIYVPAGKAREYSPLALNYFSGCDHGCKYCYVPNILGRFNSNYKHSDVNTQNLKEIETSIKKHANSENQVLLSFTGDPYCKYNDTQKTTRAVLELLLKYNVKTAILTKGGSRCLQDIDLFKQFGERIKVGASLILSEEKDSAEWEPGAATPDERLNALKVLHQNGVKTWASFEPVLSPRQSLILMAKGLDFIDFYKVGKLNNYKGLDKKIDWYEFLKNTVDLLRASDKDFYIKEDLRKFSKDILLYPNEIDMDFKTL